MAFASTTANAQREAYLTPGAPLVQVEQGAQKLLLDLKGRLGAPTGTVPAQAAGGAAAAPGVTPWRGQLLEALTGLGWTARDAEVALADVEPVAAEAEARGESPQLPVLLRAALRSLKR